MRNVILAAALFGLVACDSKPESISKPEPQSNPAATQDPERRLADLLPELLHLRDEWSSHLEIARDAGFRKKWFDLQDRMKNLYESFGARSLDEFSELDYKALQRHRPELLERYAEMEAFYGLANLGSSEVTFRTIGGAGSYWVGDVSGLYRASGSRESAMQMICPSLSMALADAAPVVPLDKEGAYGGAFFRPIGSPRPLLGYWYKMISLHQSGDSTQPYNKGSGLNPDRFAIAAFPSEYLKPGRATFIACENGQVFRKDVQGRAPEVYPPDPERDGWVRVPELNFGDLTTPNPPAEKVPCAACHQKVDRSGLCARCAMCPQCDPCARAKKAAARRSEKGPWKGGPARLFTLLAFEAFDRVGKKPSTQAHGDDLEMLEITYELFHTYSIRGWARNQEGIQTFVAALAEFSTATLSQTRAGARNKSGGYEFRIDGRFGDVGTIVPSQDETLRSQDDISTYTMKAIEEAARLSGIGASNFNVLPSGQSSGPAKGMKAYSLTASYERAKDRKASVPVLLDFLSKIEEERSFLRIDRLSCELAGGAVVRFEGIFTFYRTER